MLESPTFQTYKNLLAKQEATAKVEVETAPVEQKQPANMECDDEKSMQKLAADPSFLDALLKAAQQPAEGQDGRDQLRNFFHDQARKRQRRSSPPRG